MVADISNMEYILDSGVSENILSRHYDDMLKKHQNGEYIVHKPLKELVNNKKIEL
jgi:acyl-homoserine lactone acylase PvdQ